MGDLEVRLDRLESITELRQLAFKYALALDMRDIDAIMNLYTPDVRVTKQASGRPALKKVFSTVLRSFTASVHHVGNHIIEFDDADTAHGLVYCRCEHEVGDKWVPMYLYYLDLYARIGGRWYFRRRAVSELYGVALGDTPVGPDKVRWPGRAARDGTWHAHFPSWKEFWTQPEADDLPVAPAAAGDAFLDTMRRGDRRAIPPDFSWAQKA